MNRRQVTVGTLSAIASASLWDPLTAQAADPLVAYHGITAAAHQARVDQLSAQGYRPVSLSVAGEPVDARYAAVWVQRPGPDWVAIHGFSASQYQTRFDDLTGQGFAPVIVTATGDDDAVFAAVFEAGVTGAWFARHGLEWDALVAENERAADEGLIPRCLAVYGTPREPRFAGIWIENDRHVPWSWWWTDASAYQRYFDANLLAGSRPAYMSVAPGGRILSVFRDEPIGEWHARHGMTASDYQAEFDDSTSRGLQPLVVQAGGVGSGMRYASLFARSSQPLARRWTVRGEPFAGADELDDRFSAFMRAHAIRAASVAVARDGVVVANRGYTWAEASYPVTRPATRFRVASVSKLFTCAATYELVSQGDLEYSTRAFELLGITGKLLASQTPDADVDKITVQDLALHKSGLQRDYGDADFRKIAELLGQDYAPTRDQLVRYIYGEPLLSSPGAAFNYSNSGFRVLTSVVEKAADQPFLDYVRSAVLAPLDIDDVELGATAASMRRQNEVATYDDPGVGASQVDMADDALAPYAYGGDVVTETSEGSGGLIMSTGSVARVLAKYAAWGIGPRAPGDLRRGTMAGTAAAAFSRTDGLDVAYAFNRRLSDDDHQAIEDQIRTFLNEYGDRL